MLEIGYRGPRRRLVMFKNILVVISWVCIITGPILALMEGKK